MEAQGRQGADQGLSAVSQAPWLSCAAPSSHQRAVQCQAEALKGMLSGPPGAVEGREPGA